MLKSFAPLFKAVLKPRGSIVLELGNSWNPGGQSCPPWRSGPYSPSLRRATSSYASNSCGTTRSVAVACAVGQCGTHSSKGLLHPSLVDGPPDRPHADNRNVLKKYSALHERLLKRGSYNTGKRPSEHHIGKKSFLKNNGGRYRPTSSPSRIPKHSPAILPTVAVTT